MEDQGHSVIIVSCVPLLVSAVVMSVTSRVARYFPIWALLRSKQITDICGLEHCFVSVSLQTSSACILVSAWNTKDVDNI